MKKFKSKVFWKDWITDVAKISTTLISCIKAILEKEENIEANKVFNDFVNALQKNINDSIDPDDVIEMLIQHLIMEPIFEALCGEYDFVQKNTISQSMQDILEDLNKRGFEKECDRLQKFYARVKDDIGGNANAAKKQDFIRKIYDNFFKKAFEKTVKHLGIAYTPVLVFDFILHSVEHILKTEFNSDIANDNVHIIDPFVGTGIFITRLFQSKIIPEEQLPQKYKHEIHANEIILLAYYYRCN
ncbi:hypothetical protein [Bartonella sp. B17]